MPDLRDRLKANGITHQAVATAAGVQRCTVTQMLTGRSPLSPRVRDAAEKLLTDLPARLLEAASLYTEEAVRLLTPPPDPPSVAELHSLLDRVAGRRDLALLRIGTDADGAAPADAQTRSGRRYPSSLLTRERQTADTLTVALEHVHTLLVQVLEHRDTELVPASIQ